MKCRIQGCAVMCNASWYCLVSHPFPADVWASRFLWEDIFHFSFILVVDLFMYCCDLTSVMEQQVGRE